MTEPLTCLILPVHNRREVTLRCLRHLVAIGVARWASVIVVDDGSTDDTSKAIREEFPEVELIAGDGNLFWTGAIALGMRRAIERGAQCCVWLNDDSHPVPGAVERIVHHAVTNTCITAGLTVFVGAEKPLTIYSFRYTRWGMQAATRVEPDSGLIMVDACRGNLVAVPRAIIEAIGMPDEGNLPNYFGDGDFCLRARRAGFRCWTDPQAVAEEMEHSGDFDESWLITAKPMSAIWRRFLLKQSSLYWRANWVFLRRHWGQWRGVLLFASPYVRFALIAVIRALLPTRWRVRFWGKSASLSAQGNFVRGGG